MSSYDSNFNTMPWLSSTRSASVSTFRKKLNLNVMYPMFVNLSEYVDDPYWKAIFLDSSKGKFPKGFTFNGNTLSYRLNGRSLILDENVNSIKKFIDFIRINTGIRSPMDLEREKDYEKEHQSISAASNINEWSKFSKCNRRLIIIEYVTKMRKLYKLTQDETDQLTTLINMNMEEDVIKKNILLRDNNIVEIHGLNWDTSKRRFFLIGEPKKHIIQKGNPYDVVYIEESVPLNTTRVETIKDWAKFLKEFNKFVKKNTSFSDDLVYSPKLSCSSEGESSYGRSSNS